MLILNLGAKDQITATTSTTTEPVVSSASPVVEKKKIEVISSPTSPTSHSAIEPVTKNTSSTKTIIPAKWTEILDEPIFDCVWKNARHNRRDIGDGVARTTSEELQEGRAIC